MNAVSPRSIVRPPGLHYYYYSRFTITSIPRGSVRLSHSTAAPARGSRRHSPSRLSCLACQAVVCRVCVCVCACVCPQASSPLPPTVPSFPLLLPPALPCPLPPSPSLFATRVNQWPFTDGGIFFLIRAAVSSFFTTLSPLDCFTAVPREE